MNDSLQWLGYYIYEEGIDAAMSRSNWESIDDPEFHDYRRQYLDSKEALLKQAKKILSKHNITS